MKIKKVVFLSESSQSVYVPALGAYDDSFYLGEDSWEIGDTFRGGYVQGEVTDISAKENGDVYLRVNHNIALCIPNRAVLRIYYGEE